MRNAFADELTRLAQEDPRVVLLMGDIGNRMFNDFQRACPGRFFNCGAAEANMTGMAAGLALSGLRPVTYTINSFNTTRCLEQLRVDVCFHQAPVVIVGVGGGLAYASLGGTHHSLEDIAMIRALPGMTVVCPADAAEVRLALRAALKQDGPVYIRLGKKGEPTVHQQPPEFSLGKAITVREGSDVCLLSTGNILPVALASADELARRGVSAEVLSFHTIKPLDEETLSRVFDRFKVVATVEEHSIVGGLGGSVAEWLADHGPKRGRLVRLGTPDVFFREAGDQDHVRAAYGLTPKRIAERVHP